MLLYHFETMKEIIFPIFFLLLGATSILGQATLLREITTLFYGNELFYGAGLGLWLLFTGVGSFLAAKLQFLKKPAILWSLQINQFLLLPISIIWLRWLVAKFVPLGQLPNFWFSLVVVGIILFIFCFPLGMQFTLAASIWSTKKGSQAVNLGYFWETIGFVTAGLIFSFILSTTSFPLWRQLNQETLSFRYPNLTAAINSKYNQIIVTEKDQQYNYFLSGQLAFSNQEELENQQLLSLISPFIKERKEVLALGSPIIASEIKNRLFPTWLDFLEIDEKLLELEKDLLTTGINPIRSDPRRFLIYPKKQYDLVIILLGNPQTLLTNRYYTAEFFSQVKNILSKNGTFVLLLYIPTDYQSQEATNFAASIFQPLKKVFPNLELITPSDQLIFIASQNKLSINKNNLDPAWQEYFWYQIKSPKREQIREKLSAAQVKENTDSEPVAFFYQQLFWQTIFNFKIPKILLKVVNILPLSLFLLLLISFVRLKKEKRLGLLMATSSFVLISLEVLIIFMFQTKVGYLYSQISLIFAAITSGMAIGVKLVNKAKKPRILLNLGFLGYLSILLLFFFDYEATITLSSLYWLGMAAITGLFGGMAFASLNNLYLRRGNNLGYIYAFDLFGGCLGAFLTGSFLLPFFGVKGLILGLMGIVAFLLLPNAGNSSRTT